MNKISRTYQFEKETIRRLEALTRRLQSYPGPTLELLLVRALDEVDAGRWRLTREPVKYRASWADK